MASVRLAAVIGTLLRHVRALRQSDPALLAHRGVLVPWSLRSQADLERHRARVVRRRRDRTAEGVRVERVSVPAVAERPATEVLVHAPHGCRPGVPALFWIHGGGLVAGAAAHDVALASAWAAELGIVVVSAEYRLAPEHPYPAAIDDVHAGYTWLLEHADDLGVDRERVAVGGTSAGGGLAAALAQRAHDEGLPVAFQLLNAPMLDDRTVTRALATGEWTLSWTPASNRFGWASYLGCEPGGSEHRPYAVPARRDDLSGLAPAWIGIGSIDLFHAEDVAYAERLRAAGVPVQLDVVEGMHHAGELFTGHRPIAAYITRRTDALRRGLGLPRTTPAEAGTDVEAQAVTPDA